MSEKRKKIVDFIAGDRVLLAPLDWGLGHTTRCIPLIRSWMERGCTVVVATDEPHATLIRESFPGIRILSLRGYRIRYATNPTFFFGKLCLQAPRLIFRMWVERRWLHRLIKQEPFDYVVSDNRPGFFHPQTPSIYITHQLAVRTGLQWMDPLASWAHRKLVERFQCCWVPDWEGECALAGELSNPKKKPALPIQYMGPLSRLKPITIEKKYRFVAVISGPEPQRTLFEQMLLPWLEKQEGATALVRGLPGNSNGSGLTSTSVKFFNHLPSDQLTELMQQADWVIARSGYSTIMDLVKLEQQAVLVPTPGQAEQLYLAAHLKEHRLFRMVKQEEWNSMNPDFLLRRPLPQS
jgi:hypothetical protein